MGYRVLAAVCLLIGYGFFGKLGTVYFSNFNMGVVLICLIYWIVFSGSYFQLTSFHYYRYGSRNQLIRHMLWQQSKAIAGYMAVITAVFICLSSVYAQQFTYADVMRFYLLSVLNLWLLAVITALVKMQYGSTACAFAYIGIVAGNVLIGWVANGMEGFAFLTFPFAHTLHRGLLSAYLLIAAMISILYIGYRKSDLK